jgi:hypothetical protein
VEAEIADRQADLSKQIKTEEKTKQEKTKGSIEDCKD